jgi:hypothetical protein
MPANDLFLFVSHVAEDRVAALDVVAELERRGVKCWISARDIRGGQHYDDEIVDAIERSRAMLLIFSEHCNESDYIRREITVAGESHKLVIPFRIEDVPPRRGLRVRLSDLHWIDGFASRERAVDEVVQTISSPIAAQDLAQGTPEPERRPSQQPADERKAAGATPPRAATVLGLRPIPAAGAGVALVLCITIITALLAGAFRSSPPDQHPPGNLGSTAPTTAPPTAPAPQTPVVQPNVAPRADVPQQPVPTASRGLLRTLTGTAAISSIAFSPDGQLLVSGDFDNTVRLWQVATGQELRNLTGHTKPVMAVAYLPIGRAVASGGLDGTIKFWDPASGVVLNSYFAQSVVFGLVFAHDGSVLASAHLDKNLRLWDPVTTKLLRTFVGHTDRVFSITFSPDDKTLASGGLDNTVRLWDAGTGQERFTLNGHTLTVDAVAFSPDGKVLASASWDKTIKLWNPATGQLQATLSGHDGLVQAVAFSPNGNLLASASADRTVRLWNPANGQVIATLTGHSEAVDTVVFSPDGRLLATGSADKTIRLWDLSATLASSR